MPIKDYTIPAQTRIGHVHLKVSNLQRAIDFYSGLLGFEIMMMGGDSAAFLSAGGYHHHIGLNTWESKGSPPAPGHYPGLYHTAIVFPPYPAIRGQRPQRARSKHLSTTGSAGKELLRRFSYNTDIPSILAKISNAWCCKCIKRVKVAVLLILGKGSLIFKKSNGSFQLELVAPTLFHFV